MFVMVWTIPGQELVAADQRRSPSDRGFVLQLTPPSILLMLTTAAGQSEQDILEI